MKAKELFTPAQIANIEAAIGRAERSTSGEIRLYVEDHSEDEVLDRAAFLFHKLNMDRTAQRNGVLIYLAVQDHRFAIIGDAGINAVVAPDFWDDIKEAMGAAFHNGDFEKGLVTAILTSGEALSQHFPHQGDADRNELSNEVVIN